MATEGATGLSTAAIETMLAHGARDWHRPADLAAAREELVALTGRVALLATALGRTWDHLDHGRMCSTRQFGPCDCGLAALLADTRAVLADGVGAAGARDETAVLREMATLAVELIDHMAVTEGTHPKIARLMDLDDALDALRAGGAGGTGTGETEG